MTERPPPHKEPEDGGRRLTQRESETLGELHHLDPRLAGLYEQGLKLLGGVEPTPITPEQLSALSPVEAVVHVLEAVHRVVGLAAAAEEADSPEALAWRRALSPGLEIIREGCGYDSIPPEALSQVWVVLRDAMDVGLLWSVADREAQERFQNVLMASRNDAAGKLAWTVISAALRHYRAGLPGKGTDADEEIRERAGAPVRQPLIPLLDDIVARRAPTPPGPKRSWVNSSPSFT